ncbi:MAG: ABC transporter ATP-binding protein [Actinomycetes bacterium]
MSDAAITVDHVTKKYRLYHERNQSLKAAVMRGRRARYEEFLALDDVSFEIREGIAYGLIGENGSGKSTMLKCIARILRTDGGSITARGKLSALLELGAGFHPELSGRENVYLNGAILGLSRRDIDRRFDAIVDFSGIEQFIDAPVKNYSSGMYVRLGFAVAINVDPEILLIDEVLAVGDQEFQNKCTDKIAAMRREGRTIVVVSHALPSVSALCDEVALLEHGHLIRTGPAEDVIDHYLTEILAVDPADIGIPRRATGEIHLDGIEILGADGQPRPEPTIGDPVTMRFHFTARERVVEPVFGMSFRSGDGVLVTGCNSMGSDLRLTVEPGPGHVDLEIPRLLVAPGRYHITATIYDREHRTPIHEVGDLHAFRVAAGSLRTAGITSLGGAWRADA